LNGEELAKILCHMGYGMKLTVPDEWVDRYLPGPRIKQQQRIEQLALDYQCALRQEPGLQVFEKLRPPYTG
jgi:hypothetical protein